MSAQPPSIFQPSDLTEAVITDKRTKNALISNPETNKLSFGRIPHDHRGIPEGEIYLKLGFVGVGRQKDGGFGARHIWDKHKGDLDLNSPEEIPAKIAEILKEGVDVLVNFNDTKRKDMPVILNTEIGRVAVALKNHQNQAYYQIISAYGNKNAPGVVIGKLKNPTD